MSGHNSYPAGAMHFLYTISIMTSHVFHAVKIFLKSEVKRSDTSLFGIDEKILICLTLVLVLLLLQEIQYRLKTRTAFTKLIYSLLAEIWYTVYFLKLIYISAKYQNIDKNKFIKN